MFIFTEKTGARRARIGGIPDLAVARAAGEKNTSQNGYSFCREPAGGDVPPIRLHSRPRHRPVLSGVSIWMVTPQRARSAPRHRRAPRAARPPAPLSRPGGRMPPPRLTGPPMGFAGIASLIDTF